MVITMDKKKIESLIFRIDEVYDSEDKLVVALDMLTEIKVELKKELETMKIFDATL